MVDRYEALGRLSQLKANGVLTDAEFAAEKSRLLALDDDTERAAGEPARSGGSSWKRGALAAVAIGGIFAVTRIDWVPAQNGQQAASAPAERLTRCDTAEARAALTSAFEHSAAERLANIQVLDLSNIVERSYNDKTPERICAADVTLNAVRQHTGFRIYPTSAGDNFIVETMDDPGPTPIAVVSAEPTPAPAPSASSTVDPDNVDQWAQAARDTIERGDSAASDQLAAAARDRDARARPAGQLPIVDASLPAVYTTEAAAKAANPPGTCIIKGGSDNGEGWFADPNNCEED